VSKYTLQLRELVERKVNIFDDTWTTFVSSHKQELINKIIGHYYFNEIGAETPQRFIWYINQHMREIMPYFNDLYKSILIDLMPEYNTIIERSSDSKTGSSEITQNSGRVDNESLRRIGESLNNDFIGDEWNTSITNVHDIKGSIGNLTGNHDETENITKVGTDDYTKKKEIETDETINKTVNEITNSKEVLDGEVTSKTTGNETESITGSEYSSDTPQGKIRDNQLSIDANFLTNYKHSNSNRTRNYSEDGNTTTDNTTTFDKTVDTKDDTIRNEKTSSSETYDDDTTEKINRTKNNGDVEDTTSYSDETIDTNSTDHKTTKNIEKQFKDGSENNYGSQITSSAYTGKREGNINSTVTEKSTIGVSRARLVQEYRNSIINIDMMIIKELAVDFMGVF